MMHNRLSKRLWYAVYAAVIIGGFLFTLYGYRHGLPVIDWEDEKTIWSMGRASFDPAWVMYQSNYPPGIIAVSGAVQRLQMTLGDPYINVAVTVEIMRLMSLGMFTVTLILIMVSAHRLAGPPAAIVAGLVWIVIPIVSFQARLALVDCWVAAWFMAAILAASYSWTRQSVFWWVVSFALALLATLFKYQAAAVLIMVGLVCLRFWQADPNHRKVLVLMAVFVLVVGAFSYWLIVVHQALSQNLYLPDQKASAPTVANILTNLAYSFGGLGPFPVLGLLPLAALLWPLILVTYRRLYPEAGLWMYPVVILGYAVILSFNGAPVFDRHYVAILALLSALAGAGFWLTIQAIFRWSPELPVRLVRLAAALVVTGIVGFFGNTMFQATLAQAADLAKPDQRAVFSEWARTTATDGPMLITDPALAVSVQTLYGYRGRVIETPYNEGTFIHPNEITQAMIDAKHIRYLVTGQNYAGQNLSTPITRLVVYDDNLTYRGPGWAAFYVGELPAYPPESFVTFGDQVELRGFGIAQTGACPGDSIDMQTLWDSVTPPHVNYSYYVHLFSEQTGEISAPQNGAPPATESRPTSTWLVPGELLVGPPTRVGLPADLKPGVYQVWLGVYDPMTGVRLQIAGGADHAVVGTLTIRDCPAR